MKNDQSETKNIAAKNPEVVKSMAEKWETWDLDVEALKGYQEYFERSKR